MKHLIMLTTVSLLLTSCATFNQTQDHRIQEVVIKMVNSIDTKEWTQAEAQFEESVFVDYSSMTGQPGTEIKAKDLVGSWKGLLKEAQTHHMLTNFEIASDGKSAEVYSHVYASHKAKGIKYWDIYGRYHHRLKKTPGGWKINSMKLLVHGQKGNLKFLEQVSKK